MAAAESNYNASEMLTEVNNAIYAVLVGGQSYKIGTRQLTRADLSLLYKLNKIALNTGQKTFKQIAAEQGRDWKEQIDEMAEVLEYAKDKGIDLGGVIFDQTAAELYED